MKDLSEDSAYESSPLQFSVKCVKSAVFKCSKRKILIPAVIIRVGLLLVNILLILLQISLDADAESIPVSKQFWQWITLLEILLIGALVGCGAAMLIVRVLSTAFLWRTSNLISCRIDFYAANILAQASQFRLIAVMKAWNPRGVSRFNQTVSIIRRLAGLPMTILFIIFTIAVHFLAPVSLFVRVIVLSNTLRQPLDEWKELEVVNMAVFLMTVLSFIQTPKLSLFRLFQMNVRMFVPSGEDGMEVVTHLFELYRDAVIQGCSGVPTSCFWPVFSGQLSTDPVRYAFLFTASGVEEIRQGLFDNTVVHINSSGQPCNRRRFCPKHSPSTRISCYHLPVALMVTIAFGTVLYALLYRITNVSY